MKMSKTALGEKDNTICRNCYLRDKLGVCLLKGEEVAFDDTCKKWLAKDTYKGCLIDFKKGDDNENNKD
jgi:hypothetical protein